MAENKNRGFQGYCKKVGQDFCDPLCFLYSPLVPVKLCVHMLFSRLSFFSVVDYINRWALLGHFFIVREAAVRERNNNLRYVAL